MKNRRNGGFTLVELLIVIMIIGILAGMVMLGVGSARDSAEATRVVNDMRNLKTAALMFYADKGEWPAEAGASPTPDLAEWETYLDRGLDRNRYTFIRLNRIGDSGPNAGKLLMGLVTTPDSSANANGVLKKIEKNNASNGVLNSSGNPFTVATASSTFTQGSRFFGMILD